MSCDRLAINLDVGEVALSYSFSVDAARAWDALKRALNLAAQPLDLVQVGPKNLDPHRRLDAGEEHVEPIADRLGPHIREAWKLQLAIHLRLQFVDGHSRAPLLAWFQRDRRVHHPHGGVVG